VEHNADLAAVVNTAGGSSGIGDVQNEVVQEEDEEDGASDVNSIGKLQAIGSQLKES